MPVTLLLCYFFARTKYLPAFLYPEGTAEKFLALRNGGLTDVLWEMNKTYYSSSASASNVAKPRRP